MSTKAASTLTLETLLQPRAFDPVLDLHIGHLVCWRHRAGDDLHMGLIVAVVPPGEMAVNYLPEGIRKAESGYGKPRKTRSFLVYRPEYGIAVWPIVKNLSLFVASRTEGARLAIC